MLGDGVADNEGEAGAGQRYPQAGGARVLVRPVEDPQPRIWSSSDGEVTTPVRASSAALKFQEGSDHRQTAGEPSVQAAALQHQSWAAAALLQLLPTAGQFCTGQIISIAGYDQLYGFNEDSLSAWQLRGMFLLHARRWIVEQQSDMAMPQRICTHCCTAAFVFFPVAFAARIHGTTAKLCMLPMLHLLSPRQERHSLLPQQ